MLLMTFNTWFFENMVYKPILISRGEWIYDNLSRLMDSQYYARDKIISLQNSKFDSLIRQASDSTDYYRDYAALLSGHNLSDLPLLSKNTLRDHSSRLACTTPAKRLTTKTSGGSTGAPVQVKKTPSAMSHELAATWRGYSWADVSIGEKQARFWGVPSGKKDLLRSKAIDLVTNRYRLSAFSFDESALKRYLSNLQKFKPKYFYGYVSMIREFAIFISRYYDKCPVNIEAIITTAEILSLEDRALFEKVFECAVYNEYGCGELGTIAHECEYGSLHINDENMIVEILNNGLPCKDGEQGEIVVTELNNTAMPLIRYQLGDYGKISQTPCQCGRTLTVLSEINGREYDFFINKEHKKFHGEFFLYAFEELKKSGISVPGFQLIQSDIEHFQLKIVLSQPADIGPIKDKLGAVIDTYFNGAKLDVEQVESIERESSGKLRVIKREFDI